MTESVRMYRVQCDCGYSTGWLKTLHSAEVHALKHREPGCSTHLRLQRFKPDGEPAGDGYIMQSACLYSEDLSESHSDLDNLELLKEVRRLADEATRNQKHPTEADR